VEGSFESTRRDAVISFFLKRAYRRLGSSVELRRVSRRGVMLNSGSAVSLERLSTSQLGPAAGPDHTHPVPKLSLRLGDCFLLPHALPPPLIQSAQRRLCRSTAPPRRTGIGGHPPTRPRVPPGRYRAQCHLHHLAIAALRHPWGTFRFRLGDRPRIGRSLRKSYGTPQLPGLGQVK
jgi:hypothetical protein